MAIAEGARPADGVVSFEGLKPPYATIVADPPWRYSGPMGVPTRVGRETKNRGVVSQYDSMTLDDIAALPVADLADTEAHLYLWTTNGFLHDAFHVMEAWGFDYKACLTWVKTGHLGLGYWFRNQTEHILFGVKGKMRVEARNIRTWFEAPKAGHSVKPDASFDLIERASPAPRVELFARKSRLGWDAWGDEI